MRLLLSGTLLLSLGLATAAPRSRNESNIILNGMLESSDLKYTGQHDIVSIVVPLNGINFNPQDDSYPVLFFVEADIDDNKKRTYKGLYVLKNDKATKILDNGRNAAASADESRQVFFAATDGLYEYKADTTEAIKYGSITDSIIDIAKANASDVIYILTEDHKVYKVTDNGNTKTKVDEIVNAEQILVDYSNNLYFYGENKEIQVLTNNGVKKIEGIANPTEVTLVRPPLTIKDGIYTIVDKQTYIIYGNGTSKMTDGYLDSEKKITAYAMEADLVPYFGYDKKIYEYNIMGIIIKNIFKHFLHKAA